MAKSKYERYNFILAVLGAVTGVLSLGWQMWGAIKPIEDKIVAEYEIIVNAQHEAEILVSVTNIGEKDVYFSKVYVVYSDSKFDLGPDVPLTFNADERRWCMKSWT